MYGYIAIGIVLLIIGGLFWLTHSQEKDIAKLEAENTTLKETINEQERIIQSISNDSVVNSTDKLQNGSF